MMANQWITPFWKQCFVTAGASINAGSGAFIIGFSLVLLEQLKAPGSSIPIDDSAGSWIASLPAVFMVCGNILLIPLMNIHGRRLANLTSIALLIISWICIICSKNLSLLLFARALQGIHLGLCVMIGSIVIGECTSPKRRGVFLMTIAILMNIENTIVHLIGFYMKWQICAIALITVAILNLVMVLFSPESPSWLISQGRYEECRRVFRWLRGNDEEEELLKMIEAAVAFDQTKVNEKNSESVAKKLQQILQYVKVTMIKKEFYKPVVVTIHLNSIYFWGGAALLNIYSGEVFRKVIGVDVDVAVFTMSVDVQRIVSNTIALIVLKKLLRRQLLFMTLAINIIGLLASAVYIYAKENHILPFDHPSIGSILIHSFVFAASAGTQSLALIIAGEIYPFEFRVLAGGVSMFISSLSMFGSIKSFPYLLLNIGLHGTYFLYAMIISYCGVVAWFMLPETKDKTLQDIEDEIKGKPLTSQDLKSVQSLTSWKDND